MINQTQVRIWVLEDNDDDYELLELAFARLEQTVQIERFVRGEGMLDRMHSNNARLPRLLYVDLRMPGIGGMGILKALRDVADFELIPRLVFSTSTNPPEIIEVYRNGASAFHEKVVEAPDMLTLLERTFLYWIDTVKLAPMWTDRLSGGGTSCD